MTDPLPHFARQAADLDINPMNDGYVVYDAGRDRVHYLNPTSALILELCDGAASPAAMAALVQETFDLPSPPLADVEACLADFYREGLVV